MQAAVHLLGMPVKDFNLNLGDREHNHTTDVESVFKIPVKVTQQCLDKNVSKDDPILFRVRKVMDIISSERSPAQAGSGRG